MDPTVDFEGTRGTWSYPGAPKNLKYMGFPNPRKWSPTAWRGGLGGDAFVFTTKMLFDGFSVCR